MGVTDVQDVLERLPHRVAEDRLTLLTEDLLEFLQALGYDGSYVFLDFLLSLTDPLIADAVVAPERSIRNEPPSIIVNVKTAPSMLRRPETVWTEVLKLYGRFLYDWHTRLVLFSPSHIGVAGNGASELHPLISIDSVHLREVAQLLHNQLAMNADRTWPDYGSLNPGTPR